VACSAFALRPGAPPDTIHFDMTGQSNGVRAFACVVGESRGVSRASCVCVCVRVYVVPFRLVRRLLNLDLLLNHCGLLLLSDYASGARQQSHHAVMSARLGHDHV
jgi:hypothetical protein